MSVRVEFPVFVCLEDSPGGRVYAIRPLFLPDLVGRDRTFEQAMRAFGKLLRQRYLHHTVGRHNLEDLLWLAFNPELQTHVLKLELSTGSSGMLPAEVTAVMFDHGDHRYVCLPRFRGHVMMMPRDLRWAIQLERVQEELNAVLREIRKELAPERPDLSQYTFHKGDFVTTLPVSLGIERGKLSFDQGGLEGLFAALSGQKTVDGARELLAVAENLNHRYPDDLQRVLEPDPRVETIYQALYASSSTPIVLVGLPGSGRTTLLHEALAHYLHAAEQAHTDSDRLQNLWLLDPTRMITGMALIGAWQRRAEAIFSHLRDRLTRRYGLRRADALAIHNPVALCRVGRSAGSDLTLSAVLRPFVERRQIPIVLEASPTQWQKLEELDRPFADLFQVVRVPPASRTQALHVLIQRRSDLEARTQGTSLIQRSALRRLVELEARFPSGRAAPGALVERLERLVDRFPQQLISPELVERAFLGSSGMRPELLDPGVPLTEAALRDQIESRLIGQPDAVRTLSAVVHTVRAGLAPPGRPAASLLLVGPTGVGKTETAKVLTDLLYVTPSALVRLDMNEYVDYDAARRLIGDALQPEGQLTGRIRHQPFCVLLLDEIEKAHPNVHDLLLQLLDEGRLTDSLGRVADFSQAIVILTSNVGARQAGRRMGFSEGDAQAQAATYRAALQRAFRPEFLNRIDQIVVFGSLSREHIRRVARLQIARLLSREGLLRRTVLIDIAPPVVDWVAALGFDALLGARALKRALEHHLVAPIAERLVPLDPDVPRLLHVDVAPGETGLLLRDQPLPMLSLLPGRSLREDLATLPPGQAARWLQDQLHTSMRQLQDQAAIAVAVAVADGRLTASATPDGAQVPVEMLLLGEIQEALSALEEDLPLDTDEDDLPAFQQRALSGGLLQNYPRRSRKRQRRAYWRSHDGRAHNQERMSQDDLRATVRDLMEQTEPLLEADAGISEVALAKATSALLQTRALRLARPREVCLYLRNLTAATDGAWETYSDLIEAWGRVASTLGMEKIGQRSVDAQGRIQGAPLGAPDTDSMILFHGFGCADLFAVEEGVHLFYPPDDPPTALQVLVAPLPAGDDPPLAALLERWSVLAPGDVRRAGVRLYCPPDRSSDRGSITDLRTAQVVPYVDLQGWLADWMVRALPDDLRLRRSPAP